MIRARDKKKLVLFIGITLIGVLCSSNIRAFMSKELLLLVPAGFGGDDHNKMTMSAVTNIGNGYPDIQKFRARIIEEASNEGISGLGAHDRVSGAAPQIWADNEDDWRNDGRRLYTDKQFSDAYARFGWSVHLVEDIKVPAHQKSVFHGVGGSYVKSPADSTPISGSTHFDKFEQFASNNHTDTIAPDIEFDQKFLDPKTECSQKFWYGDSEDGDEPTGGNGAYGRNNVGCNAPGTSDGDDWFADADYSVVLTPLAQRIARAQLFRAREAAEAELKNMSEGLPPLTSNATIGGVGGSAPPIINNQSGTPISFVVAENRTQFVDIDIWIQDTGQRIVSDGMIRSLTSFRSAAAGGETSSLTGPITWLAQPVQMFGTKALDETGKPFNALPYEAEITLNWKGMVASGAPLADGDHTLCFAIKDRDGNGGTCEAPVLFKILNPSPIVTISDLTQLLANQLQGTAITTPSSISQTVNVNIHDDSAITAIALPSSPAAVEVTTPAGMSLSNIPDGTKDVTVKITNLPTGTHAFSVTNKVGKVTSGSWKVVSLALAVNSSAADYDANADAFSGTIQLAANSTVGTEQIVEFNPNTQAVIGTPYTASPFSISASISPGFRYFYMRDKSGNSVFQNLYTYQSAISKVDALQTSGGSVSQTLSFASPGDFPLPGESAHVKPGIIRIVNDTMVLAGAEQSGELAGPVAVLAGAQQYGTYSLTAGGQTIISGSFSSSGDTRVNHVTSLPVPDDIIFTLTMTRAPFVGVSRDNCLDTVLQSTCSRYKNMVPSVFAHPAVRALAYTLAPTEVSPNIRIFADSANSQTIYLGNDVMLTGFIAASSGSINKANLYTRPIEPGYINLLGDHVFDIGASDPVFYSPNFTLTLPFDGTKHTVGVKVYLARLDICGISLFEGTVVGNKATAPVNGLGQYAVVEKAYEPAREYVSGACHFISDVAGLAITESNPDARYKQAVNVIGSLGFAPVGTTCDMAPSGTTFSPPGAVKLCYSPADLAKAGVSNNPLTLIQFSKSGIREELGNMFVDRERGIVAGTVNKFNSEFGVFAASPAIAAVDLLPPMTTLSVDGLAVSTGTPLVVNTTSNMSLSAVDPAFPGAPTSGVASTFLLIDTPFVDYLSTPGLPYTAPFNLSVGSHTLTFYSTDAAGNREGVNVVNVLANPPPTRGIAGLAIGRDTSSRQWTVALDNGAVTLARTDDIGAMIASVPLPQALSDGRWSLLFDATGGVYAVGSAEGASTQASDVAVYKASPNGDALASSGYFDGGRGGNDFVFDAAAPGWVAGAIEISEGSFQAVLWRFNPGTGAVSLSTGFALGAAMGVAVDADGSVWTAGYVRNPSPRSSRVYDLGLWHFAADGQTLLGGPYLEEAYVAEFSPTSATKIAISSSAVTVAASRGRSGGGTDLGTVRFDKVSGAAIAESAWRAADGSSAYAAALLPDGEGVLAAGGLDSGATRAALWRYGADGALASAALVAAGGARGAAASGSDLWLAVDDATAPYKVAGESALSGSLADFRPPRVELAVSTPSFVSGAGTVFVAPTSRFSFTSVDDKLAAGDGLGAGATAVYDRADSTGAFAAFSGPFGFAAEGTHTVEFYGVDAADNPGPILSRTINLDLTAPVTQSSQNGAEIALEASDGTGAGVSRIRYLVDYGDPAVCNNVAEDTAAPRGTCENPWYAGPFVLSNGPHALYYQAFDAVGNAEVLRSTYPFVEAPGSGPSAGGMGIGKDALDAFWTVVSENNALAFAHSDSSGALISSSTLQDATAGFPWSVFFGPDDRAYAVGGATGPATQALDLAVYKASPEGDAIESRTLFDSGYANNDIAFDAKAPGWIVGAAQTSGPTDLEAAAGGEFSMALWRFDPALGTVQLKTTYARAGFDLGAGLAVDADGSLWIAGYSLSPAAPAVGGFDLALWHYAANGQTLLGGPFLRSGYLDNLDGGLTARVFVSSQAVYVAAPRANNLGGTDMAFLRYDKASGLPTSEIAWRPADGAPSYPIAVLPEASGILVAGGIGGNLTEAGLWRFGFDGALQGVTTADAGGATGAVFRGTELWLSVDGSTVPYRVQAEVAVAGSLVDLVPPRTSVSAGMPSFTDAPTVYVTSATPLGFAVADDYLVAGDGLGVGATQTFYAEAGGAYSRFTSSFTLVAEGTHTISFYSIDLEGRVEAVKTQSVGVDLTAPVATLVSSGSLFSILAVDPLVGGAASGVGQIQYLVDHDPECNVAQSTAAPPGTCENLSYAGPFELAAGTHTVYYAATDRVLNGAEVTYSSFITVVPPPAGLALTSISPMIGGNGGPVTVSVSGSGISAGAALELNRILAGGSGFTTSGALAARLEATAVRLANGKVLIAGGQDYNTAAIFSSAAIFDPNTGSWSATGAMAVPRFRNTMTLLPNGKVLVVGGMSCSSCNGLNTAELYDPASGTWSYTGSLAAVRVQHTATPLANGKVLVSGGGSTSNADLIKSSAELYDPATGVWTSAGVMPSGAHFWHAAAALPDGRVVVAGGRNSSMLLTAAVDIYNPTSNTWAPGAPMSATRSRYTLDLLPNGKLMASAGDAGVPLATTEIYDPASGAGTWSAGAPLSANRSVHSSARLSDGKILVVGGFGSSGFVSAAELFDPGASSWTTVGSLPRFGHTETALADGRILVAGGRDPSGPSATSIYSPASQSIVASNLTYSGGNVIGGVLDLTGQSLGLWDVIVTNPDQSSARLSNAFTIYDTAPPSAVVDLAISTLGASTATLTWTAPSGQGGAAASYDLRRATAPITEANFLSAASIPAPVPAAPGTSQTAALVLGADSSVFVALRSRDIYGNVSGISNVAGLARSATLINGAPEASIWATQPVSIAMSSSGTALIQAAAAAQGLTQVSAIYDPNPKSVSFVGGAHAAFVYDPATLSAQGIPAESLRIYQFIGGTLVALSSQTISGQTLAASAASFGGVLGMFGVVPAPTIIAISPALGGNGGPLTVSVSGSGIVAGAGLELNRILAGGSGFTTSGALAARLEATAVRFANGKVLIAGGQDYNTSAIFSSATIFDPNTGTWSATGSMAVPRYLHTMTLLPNGKVLVVGGMSCTNCSGLSTAELYDPASGTWSYTGALAAVRVNHTATALPNGKVLVAGGGSTSNADLIKSSAELFDPATGLWTSAGIMPSGAHFWHAAALLPDGRVVVAGGRNSSMLLTAAVDIYNPATNAWSPAAPMSSTRSRYTLDLLPNGKLIATGGDAGVPLASTEIYDPAPGAGTWTAGAALSSKRSVHASARLSDGKILVIGGFAGSAGFVSAAELFDPVASSWTTVGNLPRLGHTETSLADGRILVAGGRDPSGPSATSIYSPASVSIAASNLTYSGGNAIGGVLDLTGQSVGLWDVVVTNPNRLSARLPNAFTIHGSAPPSSVTDLALSSIGLSTVTLQWTAPASPSGALSSYEIRYASFPLDSGNFASGTPVNGPAPAPAGTSQSASIGGLDGVTAFYAALKSRDVYGNVSALSNVASWVRGTTAVGDQPEFTFSANVAVTAIPVSTFTTPGTVVLATATAQGLTLVSSIYDLGPEGAVFNPYARMTFVYSPTVLASLGLLPGDIKIYQYVSGLGMVAVSSQTIDTAANTITGYVPSLASIFAVFGVIKDRAAPVTSLSPGASATFADGSGNLYASPAASFGFSAYDPVVFGTASGVARTNYRVDGPSTAPFSLYASTFSLSAEGQRTLWFYSEDHAGNVEVARSSGVLVDAAAPITALQVFGSSVAGVSGGLAVSSTTTIALSAADPVSNGIASGVSGIFYSLDANPASPYAGPFALPPGAHSLSYFSKDNVANAETASVLSVLVDTVAPRSVLFVDGVAAAGPAIVLVSTNSLGFSASDAGAGVAQILYSLDGGAEQVYVSTFSLSAGSHSLAYRGVDRLGNAEAANQAALDVLLYDVTPPSVALSIIDQSTITTAAPFIAATYGDDGRGVDVSSVRLTLDGADVTAQAAVSASSTTFSPALSQGSHALSISFADFAGNQTSAAASFFVDSLPPATILQVNGVAASTAALVVVSTDSLGFASLDAGTGVAQTVYALDGGAPIVYVSTFSLAAGAHTLSYHSVDRVGNVESSVNAAVSVLLYDAAPPSLVLTPASGSTVTTAVPLITAVYSDTGRGVDASSVRISLDGLDVTSEAAVSASSAVFTPSAALSQATHAVVVQVSDLAGNQTVSASTFLVDSLPPVTTLLVDGLGTSATNLVLISTDSIGFSATDGGTGVLQTRYSLDGSPIEVLYVSTFSLTAGEHTLTYRSVDLGGNEEGARTVSLSVFGFDVTPPALSLAPSHGSTVTVATPLIAALYGDLGRGIDVSSVKIFLDGVNATAQAVVTASSAVFTPGAPLSQGVHTVTAEVADLAGNRSSGAATFLLDSVAPVTTLLVNGLATSATSLVIISTDSVGFSALDAGVGTAETRYALDGSTDEVVYVSPFNLTAGAHTLSFHSRDFAGNVEAARTVSIAVLAYDTTPPSLAIAPIDGSAITTTTPEIRASYSDPGRGVDLASVRISLDGQDVTPSASIGASSASFTPAAALSQGTHTVTAAVNDLAGNVVFALATFHIDSLPPMTTLLVNGHAAGSANLVLASTDAVSFAAADSGVGVLETRYSVDGSSETIFTAPFFLSPGSNSLAFHSRDRAGNEEAIRVVSVVVTTPSTDTTPPLVRLDLPGISALGVEQALGGVVDVRGAVSDASALAWTLEVAPGAAAAGGFATIASGAGNLSGLVSAWNTTSLSGYQTVRLRATDAFGNSASATATVFVGGPVFTFAVGRKDSHVIVNTIKGPTGIAVRSDGAIWVASTENDKILLLSPGGVLLGEAGRVPGHSGREKERGKKDKDRDDEDNDEDSGGLSFKTPQGLALDSADNLYVADRDLNRVVKLSPDGRVSLLQLGKAGSGNGELRHPFDVAVDGNGDVYVADSGNRRIQVFNSSAGYLRQFGQGVLLSTSEIRGITLTAEGLWVSDKERERIFLFSRAGVLLKSIGGADSAVGELSRMRGLASDRLGALYVVEPNRDRVQKFDPKGKGLLAFGSKAGLSQADKKAKRYLTQPIDAALAPDGSIWIADTGRDRIVRYALPSSGGYGTVAYAAGGGEFSSSSAEPARRVVDHKDGAKVERDDGAGVSVPKGALAADLEITVEKGDENQDKEQKTAKRREMKIAAVSEEVQYGPEGTTFAAPVTLILPYDANLIASQGIREEELKVYYWNPTLKDWQAMPSTVDKQSKTVHAQTTHFSAYQVGGLGGIGVAAVDDFGLRDGYAFPNPSRNGSAVTFRMQPGSVDSIEVRVYDLSGRKVHSSSDFRFLGAIDDGNGKGVQNTYDHIWNVSGVGSGVYTFVMTARKAGQPDIRKTGKAGVIK